MISCEVSIQSRRNIPLVQGIANFFVPRLKFIADRYEQLVQEMQRRGYKPNPISRKELLDKIDPRLHNDYTPTAEAVKINQERIAIRLQSKIKEKQNEI